MRNAVLGLALAALALAPAQAVAQQFQYPQARKGDVVDDYHGTKVADPYRWLEDVDAEETKRWIEAENKITFAYLESIPEREFLRERLTQLWNYERYGVPSKEGDLYVYSKNDGLQNQSVIYMQASLDGEPEVLIDPNKFSEDGTVSLRDRSFSEDGSMLAYSISRSGSDWREYFVRDMKTGEDLDDHLVWVKFTRASWTHDNVGFFYSRFPTPEEGEAIEGENVNQKIYYHRVGTPQAEDQLIYEISEHPRWRSSAFVTDDGRYLVFSIRQGAVRNNRISYRDLGDPEMPNLEAGMVDLIPEFEARFNFLGNDGSNFYFRTDLDSPRYRVIAIDLENPGRDNWVEVIPEGEDVLQSVEIINHQFVARYLHDAHSVLRVYSMNGEHVKDIELPTIGSVRSVNGEPEDTEMFYSFASFLYPTTIFRYDFEAGENSILHAPSLDFDPSHYETKQVFYYSQDGTRVPMFITHKKGIEMDGMNPTYLYGYGGFNISLTPRFSTSNLVWLEMGGIYAQANMRGGGEYGEEWHEAGTKERKQSVFDDFIAAAEYLMEEGYTSRRKLAIGGGSNGGLLVGAVMTQRPDLFGATLPAVGVMDMLRFHKFTVGFGWISDYGSSDDPEGFEYLYAYSPLHNLRPAAYPPTMVTTADHDDRVVPGHSFKFAATLQEVHTGDAPVLIRIQTKAGHGSGKPTAMIIEEQADRWAFLIKNLGVVIPMDHTR